MDLYDQDAELVHPLDMTPGQAYTACMDILYGPGNYTPAEEFRAQGEQTRAALRHTQYQMWLLSTPSAEEIAATMRTLSETEAQP
jgi:hypothetical protein